MYEYILFDFDGTLMDTSEGVFHSFDHVVEHYKLGIDKAVYSTMIGPPLKDSFANTFKLPQSEIHNAINVYREYYEKDGMFEARVYDGVVELIEKLRKAGKKIFVATSKPQLYAKQILERKNMLHLFDFVGGADLEEQKRVNKVDVINFVFENNRIDEEKKQKCLMIGDRHFDVNGAHQMGFKAAGILWGFGSRKEFEDCGADYILETPNDVEKFILG